ncbi:PREDICTED: putative nuclease HARBI1 [Priapulus caudatus]|uniref:Nuclease HARBI1 n=1 Tax=Priapulus caudatus TaxID=37621 RepID=A0ABM1ECY6_PRICU|nr:PREDICTED: putative nuclease HARBI1 [Priapulus caudatus]
MGFSTDRGSLKMAAPMQNRASACFYEFLSMIMDDDEQILLRQLSLMMSTQALGVVDKFPVQLPKILQYAENIVPQYNFDDFRYHYRLSRESFQYLLEQLGPRLIATNIGGDVAVLPQKMMLIFVWYMATQESMRETAHLFGISISTTHGIIMKILDIVTDSANQFIQWPTLDEQERISRELQEEYIIDGAIGYIDGTHIRLNHRIKEDQDYINRKKFPSIQLQIVVDPKMRIINANAGWPGCVNDARVLSNCVLYQKAERGELFGDGKFIIGDSAYPVRGWLIPVIKDNGRITPAQRKFNGCLSSMRQLVERVIGHLKGRFRRLRCVHIYRAEIATKLIIAACVLHNVCIANREDLDEFIENDLEDNRGNMNFGIQNNNEGIVLRDQLVALFE